MYMASSAQPCGRLSSLYSQSLLIPLFGSKLDHGCVFRGFRNTGIRCKHTRSCSNLTEPISRAERKSSRQRSRKHQLKHQSLASYKSRFALALQAELNAEQQEIKERLKTWPKQKLEAEGVALFDLHVQYEGSLYRDKLLKLYTRLGDGMLPAHNQFSQGDIVVMSRNNPLAEDESVVEGVVVERARSNVAVDNLVEGFLELGLRVARVGQPVKVKEELRECTVDAQVANHPLLKKASEKKNISIEQMRRSKQINNTKRRSDGVKESKVLWDRAEELEARAIADVLNRADVVACTCIGAGDEVLLNRSFSVCVIDEATQATEPATLVPLLRSGADIVVLVGDPVQLPPTILSSEAMMAGLDVSLYQHLQECGLSPCFLDTQYRMHPDIAALPSKMFYSGKLKSFPSPSDRPAPKGMLWPNVTKPIVFLDCVDGREESTSESTSWFNHVEATQVVEVLQQLKSGDDIGGWEDIGVIAPYNAQVRLLKDLLFSKGKDGHTNLEVKTVDGFQGREKEVIVFCTVRANPRGELGFVSDPRRMNVALTRAKRGLVVIGNSQTLMCDKNWATWLAHIKKQKLYHVVQSIKYANR